MLTDSQDDRNDYRGPKTDSAEKNNGLVIERSGGEERISSDPEAHNQHGSYDSDPSDDRPAAKYHVTRRISLRNERRTIWCLSPQRC